MGRHNKMNFKKNIIYILFFIVANSVNAIELSSGINILESEDEFTSITYKNNTKQFNLYEFSIYKIDKPRPNSDESKIEINNGEVIFSPLKRTLEKNKIDFLKIFYNGDKDSKERYYKISIKETLLSSIEDKKDSMNFYFQPQIVFDTYLIIRPREIDFKYDYDINKKNIKNIGNTTFMLILEKECNSNDESTKLYLLPGESANLKKMYGNKYVEIFDRYINIDTKCPQNLSEQ